MVNPFHFACSYKIVKFLLKPNSRNLGLGAQNMISLKIIKKIDATIDNLTYDDNISNDSVSIYNRFVHTHCYT